MEWRAVGGLWGKGYSRRVLGLVVEGGREGKREGSREGSRDEVLAGWLDYH